MFNDSDLMVMETALRVEPDEEPLRVTSPQN